MITKNATHQSLYALVIFLLLFLLPATSFSQSDSNPATGTQIVLLGTGNPRPDPDRSGPATAIVVNGSAYLVDFGPGVVRRAAAAVFDKGVKALESTNLKIAFVTHLHSDRTVGYPDLIFTPWVMGRKQPLEVYGPKGIKAMTEHILMAYEEDIKIRSQGLERHLRDYNNTGYKVNVHEIQQPDILYKDTNITVTAFRTKHGEWETTYGYRFDTPDRSIVISGDTNPTQATIDACHGCDVLIHEVMTQGWLARRPDFQVYASKYHTTTKQLAELATKAKPGLLILYHASIAFRPGINPIASSPEELLREMREGYSGKMVVGHDLDIY